MSPDAIRHMREMLASQPEPPQPKAPLVAKVIQTLVAARAAVRAPETLGPPLGPSADPDESLDPTPPAGAAVNLPPELLLGSLGPRRERFGQRDPELEPLPLPATGAGGETHEEATSAARAGPGVAGSARAIAASDAETPFFPDDWIDEAAPPPLSSFGRPPNAFTAVEGGAIIAAGSGEPPLQDPAYILAELAAKLAAEGAAISRRLAEARAS